MARSLSLALPLALLVATLSALHAAEAPAQESPSPASSGSLDDIFKRFDRNGDGKFDASEASGAVFFKPAGRKGDGAAPMTSRVKPAEIPETESPIQTLDAEADDGRVVRAFWRKPKGDGPFPAVVLIHGGLTQFTGKVLERQLLVNPVVTRMLAGGYAVVQATFCTDEQDVQSRGPVEDVRALVHALATAPGVDAQSIELFSGSGGNISLELGGDPAVRAVIAGELATLYTGEYRPRLAIMASPEEYLTPELRHRTLGKLKTLRAPALTLHGDRHDFHKLNKPLFLPLMKQGGVKVEYREYPSYGHGFYFVGGDYRWGKGADDKIVGEVVRNLRASLDREMPAVALS
jgi:acetyl esterase/lipase